MTPMRNGGADQVGASHKLARYTDRRGEQRIVFLRRVRGACRVLDRPAGSMALTHRWMLVANDLHRITTLRDIVQQWLSERATEVQHRDQTVS